MEQKKNIYFIVLGFIEKWVCAAAIISLVILALIEVFAKTFGLSVPAFAATLPFLAPIAMLLHSLGLRAAEFSSNSAGIMTHLLLLLGLFAAMFAAKKENHLSISVFLNSKNEKTKQFFSVTSILFAVFICTILVWNSISFIKIGVPHKMIGFIPIYIFAFSMPISFTVMAFRYSFRLPEKASSLFPLAMLFGTAAALPAIVKIIWGIDYPDPIDNFLDGYFSLVYNLRYILVLLLIGFAVIGAPIFTVLAGASFVLIQIAYGESEVINNFVFSALTDSSLIIIPLFILTGFFLSESRAAQRLLYTFRCLFGRMPGSYIIVTLIICTFFTAFTGASGVVIIALGGIFYTILAKNDTYNEKFSIGLLTSAAGIGLLFPPSLAVILIGSTMRTDITQLFLGFLIPGFILLFAMIITGIIITRKVKIPKEKFTFKQTMLSFKGSIFELLLPVILILGFFTGTFSLVELGAVSLFYIFIVEVLIYREIKFKSLPKLFFKALPIIGGILIIIAMSKSLSFAIADSKIPDTLASWIKNSIESKIVFLLILNLILLAAGCIIDIFSAILIIFPLIVPLGAAYGIDPVHLGVIFILNMGIGFLTPPTGLNLIFSSYRFEKPITQVCRYIIPFFAVQLIILFLVTYLPVLATFLPGVFNS